ncbi:MAG TPA: hemerythrin family protein [Gemmatimonadaceae bacterium]|jgi:hemerythrin
MQWNDSFATGVPQIDDQHKSLFRAVAALSAAIEQHEGSTEYLRLLGYLDRYCRDHFVFEEGCMERHRCPAAQVNKQQHAGLLQLLGEHRRFHAQHGYDQHDAQLLLTSLQHWLLNHIVRVDRTLRLCVKSSSS